MTPIAIHPIIFYLFVFCMLMIFAYSIAISWMHFSKSFKDVVLFIDAQNRWDLRYVNLKGTEEIAYQGGTYVVKGNFVPPLNKSGKALFKFSVNNPQPETLAHSPAKEIDSKTIMSIINNKLVQILMSLQSSFVAMQWIMLIASCVGAIASSLVALKAFGVIK